MESSKLLSLVALFTAPFSQLLSKQAQKRPESCQEFLSLQETMITARAGDAIMVEDSNSVLQSSTVVYITYCLHLSTEINVPIAHQNLKSCMHHRSQSSRKLLRARRHCNMTLAKQRISCCKERCEEIILKPASCTYPNRAAGPLLLPEEGSPS